ncbi:MAG TPA: DUF5916 domain-containing protein [Longimicrobiaceae bacterium]|nr:DUF5916 domain-containing protein [Longimicrobiaceae bacterium]
MNASRILFAVVLTLATVAPARAQTGASSAAPTLRASRLTGAIRVDGALDEPAWNGADVATDFTQSYPNPGAAPTQRTEARVLYSNDALYVGVRLYDEHPDSIAAQLARRDASGIYSDWLHVIIGSYHDNRTAFRFSINPRGVQKDVFTYNDGAEDIAWDAVWESAVQVDSLGWTAELRIPLSQLRFSGDEPPGGRVWGLQIMRDIARNSERDSWSPWTPNSPGFVSRFGELTGLVGLKPVRRAELLPYVSTRLSRVPGNEADPFYSANDFAASAGADFKLGLTPGLTLTGTVNPDFGQVEVDPAVVNLSAFETFFDEKRPFFVEGADIFRFGQVGSFNNYNFEQFFYSRRIGRSPQRALVADSIEFVDAPSETTILGAAKVSGKTGPWTIGVMDALTSEERAHFVTAEGRQGSAPVEPMSNYLVGRVRRDFHEGGSVLGAMVTATDRDMSGSAFDPLLRSRAFFGGIDGEHTWSHRLWTLSGYLAGSRVSGSPRVITATQRSSARYFQRPDADYLSVDPDATDLGGHMGEIALQRAGDWDLSLDYKESSPGFEINDVGFQTRTDFRAFTTFLGRRVNEANDLFRNHSYFTYTYHVWNFGGTSILQGGAVGANATLNNFWSGGLNVGFRPGYYDDRLTRGGPLARAPGQWSASAQLFSDSRKVVSGGASFGYTHFTSGAWNASFALPLDYRPSGALRLRLTPAFNQALGRAQFVTARPDPLATETFGTRYLFSDIRQTTVSMETRLDWTFSPTLSLQLYAQPFVAVGDYRNFKEFLRPRSYDFAVYGEDRGTLTRGESCAAPDQPGGLYLADPDGAGPASCFAFGEPDFNVRSLRGNAVLRWEYRPGSVLFFVWQQQRDGFDRVGDFRFGRDAGEIFNAPARNVFLIKATYWLGR